MKLLLNYISVLLGLMVISCSSSENLANSKEREANQVNWEKQRVLVYTKNGHGFIHDNIPSAVASIQKLGREHGFKVDVSDNPDDDRRKLGIIYFAFIPQHQQRCI